MTTPWPSIAALLSRPIRAADLQLLQILEAHAQEILAELPATDDLVGRLEQFVVGALAQTPAGLGVAARALGHEHAHPAAAPARARHRSTPGWSTRCAGACRSSYLADASLSLGEIAYLLGYSESSAFNRAYRRWTGRTPAADRRSVAA